MTNRQHLNYIYLDISYVYLFCVHTKERRTNTKKPKFPVHRTRASTPPPPHATPQHETKQQSITPSRRAGTSNEATNQVKWTRGNHTTIISQSNGISACKCETNAQNTTHKRMSSTAQNEQHGNETRNTKHKNKTHAKHKTLNTKHKILNTKHNTKNKTRSTKHNTKHMTQRARHKSQDTKHKA